MNLVHGPAGFRQQLVGRSLRAQLWDKHREVLQACAEFFIRHHEELEHLDAEGFGKIQDHYVSMKEIEDQIIQIDNDADAEAEKAEFEAASGYARGEESDS